MKDRDRNEQFGLFEVDPEDGNDRSFRNEPEIEGRTNGVPFTDLERYRRLLEESGHYRVLRRSGTRSRLAPDNYQPVGKVRRGVFLDVETTGLDSSDPIIELGAVVFEFDSVGQVLGIAKQLDAFEDPGRPIPPGIVELTGITDDMVRGRSIDDSEVQELLAGAELVVAHNAGFDRPIVEKRFPFFASLPWACSVVDVDWQRAGVRSRKLEFLAMTRGFYYDSHRAINDCVAGVELLAAALTPDDDQTALANMLESTARETVRLWAERSPFESKDLLKARRYRWNGTAKVWWRDISIADFEHELEWLTTSVYQNRPPLPYFTFDARSRFSNRLPHSPPRDGTRR